MSKVSNTKLEVEQFLDRDKTELVRAFFDQIEIQVQFGDNKASLLIAGDAILLAISGSLIRLVSGCQPDNFMVDCMVPSIPVALALASALCLVASLACALWAARPSRIHDNPPQQFFLSSYIARQSKEQFANFYEDRTYEVLMQDMLDAIHGKAGYATRKFRWLKHAIHATLLSLLLSAATVFAAAVLSVFL